MRQQTGCTVLLHRELPQLRRGFDASRSVPATYGGATDPATGERTSHSRELRLQSGGRPIRVFCAFDPRQSAILLIGGEKTENDRFYQQYGPLADRLYDEHLEELRQEGLI